MTRTHQINFHQDDDKWTCSWKVKANMDVWFEFKNLVFVCMVFFLVTSPMSVIFYFALGIKFAAIYTVIMVAFMTLVTVFTPRDSDTLSSFNIFNYRRAASIEFNERGYKVLGKFEKFIPYEEIESVAVVRRSEGTINYHAIHIMNVIDEITTYSMPAHDEVVRVFLKALRKHVSVTDIKSMKDKLKNQ